MAGRETATVETLTASVKTLMVGARQAWRAEQAAKP